MRFPPEFGIQRNAQVFGCVLIWNNVVVDIDWLVLDTLYIEISVTLWIENQTKQDMCHHRITQKNVDTLSRDHRWYFMMVALKLYKLGFSDLYTSLLMSVSPLV
jgi:hypothetical protein